MLGLENMTKPVVPKLVPHGTSLPFGEWRIGPTSWPLPALNHKGWVEGKNIIIYIHPKTDMGAWKSPKKWKEYHFPDFHVYFPCQFLRMYTSTKIVAKSLEGFLSKRYCSEE